MPFEVDAEKAIFESRTSVFDEMLRPTYGFKHSVARKRIFREFPANRSMQRALGRELF